MTMTIGELTTRYGITQRAVRLYEARGLFTIPHIKGRRRLYTVHDERRLQAILRLKRCGLSLREIHALLPRHTNGDFLLPLKLVREQIEELERRQREIGESLNELRGMEALHKGTN